MYAAWFTYGWVEDATGLPVAQSSAAHRIVSRGAWFDVTGESIYRGNLFDGTGATHKAPAVGRFLARLRDRGALVTAMPCHVDLPPSVQAEFEEAAIAGRPTTLERALLGPAPTWQDEFAVSPAEIPEPSRNARLVRMITREAGGIAGATMFALAHAHCVHSRSVPSAVASAAMRQLRGAHPNHAGPEVSRALRETAVFQQIVRFAEEFEAEYRANAGREELWRANYLAHLTPLRRAEAQRVYAAYPDVVTLLDDPTLARLVEAECFMKTEGMLPTKTQRLIQCRDAVVTHWLGLYVHAFEDYLRTNVDAATNLPRMRALGMVKGLTQEQVDVFATEWLKSPDACHLENDYSAFDSSLSREVTGLFVDAVWVVALGGHFAELYRHALASYTRFAGGILDLPGQRRSGDVTTSIENAFINACAIEVGITAINAVRATTGRVALTYRALVEGDDSLVATNDPISETERKTFDEAVSRLGLRSTSVVHATVDGSNFVGRLFFRGPRGEYISCADPLRFYVKLGGVFSTTVPQCTNTACREDGAQLAALKEAANRMWESGYRGSWVGAARHTDSPGRVACKVCVAHVVRGVEAYCGRLAAFVAREPDTPYVGPVARVLLKAVAGGDSRDKARLRKTFDAWMRNADTTDRWQAGVWEERVSDPVRATWLMRKTTLEGKVDRTFVAEALKVATEWEERGNPFAGAPMPELPPPVPIEHSGYYPERRFAIAPPPGVGWTGILSAEGIGSWLGLRSGYTVSIPAPVVAPAPPQPQPVAPAAAPPAVAAGAGGAVTTGGGGGSGGGGRGGGAGRGGRGAGGLGGQGGAAVLVAGSAAAPTPPAKPQAPPPKPAGKAAPGRGNGAVRPQAGRGQAPRAAPPGAQPGSQPPHPAGPPPPVAPPPPRAPPAPRPPPPPAPAAAPAAAPAGAPPPPPAAVPPHPQPP